MICRVCGCTDDKPCVYVWEDGEPHTCYWIVDPITVTPTDLCSECADVGDVQAPLLYDAYGGVLVR